MSQRKWSPFSSPRCTHFLCTMKPWPWKGQWGNSIYYLNIVKMIFEYKIMKTEKYLKCFILHLKKNTYLIFYVICVSQWGQATCRRFIELPVHKCKKVTAVLLQEAKHKYCIKPTGAYIVAPQGCNQSQITCFCQVVLNICLLLYAASHCRWVAGHLPVIDHHFYVYMLNKL